MTGKRGAGSAAPGKDRVGIVVPPPAYPLAGLGVAWLLQWAAPLPGAPAWLRLSGGVLAILAVAFALWAVATLVRARTPVDPYRPTTAVVETGPYRRTRNPIYLAFTAGMLGIGLALGWTWSFLVAPLVFVALDILVVRREEAYLSGKFGDAYAGYRQRVRRWL